MHDESPNSRRDRRSDETPGSAFDALGLSALFGDPTSEIPVVDASGPAFAPPADAAPQAPTFSWLADEPARAPWTPASESVRPDTDGGVAFADTIGQPPAGVVPPAPIIPPTFSVVPPAASAPDDVSGAQHLDAPWTRRPVDQQPVDASDERAASGREGAHGGLPWLSSDTAAVAIAASARSASFNWLDDEHDSHGTAAPFGTAAPQTMHDLRSFEAPAEALRPFEDQRAPFEDQQAELRASGVDHATDTLPFDAPSPQTRPFDAFATDQTAPVVGGFPYDDATHAFAAVGLARIPDGDVGEPDAAAFFSSAFGADDGHEGEGHEAERYGAFDPSGTAASVSSAGIFEAGRQAPWESDAGQMHGESTDTQRPAWHSPQVESAPWAAAHASAPLRARDLPFGDDDAHGGAADSAADSAADGATEAFGGFAAFGAAGAASGSGGTAGGGDAGSGGGGAGGGSGRGGSGRGRGGGASRGGSGSGGRGSGPLAGILTWIRHNPRTSLIAGIAVGVVLLSGLSFGLGAATAPANAVGTAAAHPSATPSPTPTVRPTPSAIAQASKVRTCSVASYAADAGFGTLEAQVRNASTGEVLYDRNGSNPAPTASVLKMLTAAAAFSVLGPNYRVPTIVVKGTQPGQVVVIGGGDVTLTRLPTGEQSFYTNAPHLDDLANQVKQAWNADPSTAGQPITSLVVDTSLYSGPVWLSSWDEHEERVVEGSTPYMTSFMVDGDRDDPTAVESPRSADPVGRAAQALADDLGGGITISQGTAPAGAKQLGEVQSQPVSALVEQALTYSDNTIMEELARLVAIKTGAGNSFSAINAGTLKGLQSYGIPTTGLYFADGSGLSADNRVPASYLTQFLIKVLNRQGSLGAIYDGFPVAGQTGTLGPGYGRFDGSFSSNAVGHVNAKTGWINTSRTLAGVIHAKDGTNLTFAIYALNYPGDDAALNAIDNLTTAFYECGNNLSNY